uniref:cation:proton antiporter domain-containing protein n=1 Tax=Frankia sp. Cr1 TaxID=3073931 RepID=UPI002AD4DDC0
MNTEHLAVEVFLGAGVVLALTSAVSPLCRRVGQPAVVGHILVGLVLGLLPDRVVHRVFPVDALPFLTVIAQVGVLLFLFAVGYALDLRVLRGRARGAVAVSVGGLGLPLVFGGLLALTLIHTGFGAAVGTVGRASFVEFVAVALAITAVPVLALIIQERGMESTPTGVVAITAAAIMDLAGWLLLAMAVAAATPSYRSLPMTALLLAIYLAVLV